MEKVIKCLSNIAIIVVWLCAIVCTGVVCVAFCMEYLKMTEIDSNWVVAISTFLATIAAVVFGCFGENIKNYFAEKPNIVFFGIHKIKQEYVEFLATSDRPATKNQSEVYRLILKNDSHTVAKDVEVYLQEINAAVSRDLIPAPLQWTHLSESFKRDIAPGQIVYLDFIQSLRRFDLSHPTSFVAPHLRLNASMIQVDCCNVKLVLYGKNITPKTLLLVISYKKNRGNFPTIEIHEEKS